LQGEIGLTKDEIKRLNFDENKLAKLKEIEKRGIKPYAYRFDVSSDIASILNKYKDIGHEKSKERVAIAGRIYTIRVHGKALFADIRDGTGKIQVYIRQEDVGERKYEFFKEFIDSGDIIGVEGNIFRTKMGEITLWAINYELLSKALCFFPEKFHGLRDTERRYRERHLDLICNLDVREVFVRRTKAIHFIRNYLANKGFMEVETPILQPVYGGANARPFETFHNFLEQKLYLRIAPELYLKRLVVGGFEKVFEIAKNFRNESIDTLHNPEFTMIEIYEAYKDYNDMMNLTEELISAVVKEICGTYKIDFSGTKLDFKPKWKRITMADSVKENAKLDVMNMDIKELREIAKEHKIAEAEAISTKGEFLVLFFENLVEQSLVQPTFITDFPIEVSPLAKQHRSKQGVAERFELFVNGWELANGFSELNDPLEQKLRFEEQKKISSLKDTAAQSIDYDYVTALGYGLPPTGGVGIGIDRLILLIANRQSLKEVILFPQMRSYESEVFKDFK